MLRLPLLIVPALSLSLACGGSISASQVAARTSIAGAAQTTTPPPDANTQPDAALVVEGRLDVSVSEISTALSTIRDDLRKRSGRIVSEHESGAGESWTARLVVRLPPAAVDSFVETLAGLGSITSKQIDADDVGKTLHDQEIALANLNTTLERMRALLQTGGLKMAEILEVEREMTRLRKEIETIKGERRYLKDRVAYATLTLNLSRDGGAILSPTAKLFPGPRLSTLVLLRPGDRQRVRVGAGLSVHFPVPRLSIDVDVFDRADDESSASVIATLGGAIFSDFLGRGRRRFLNPYIGLRAGYGYLEESRFVVAGDIGVELFKSSRFMVDAGVRTTALIGEESDVGFVGSLTGVVAF